MYDHTEGKEYHQLHTTSTTSTLQTTSSGRPLMYSRKRIGTTPES